MYRFTDRKEAGKKLAEALAEYAGRTDLMLLALPRGGVPVAHEIATALSLRLDVLLVRKLGVPGHEELAMGAIAWDHIYFINHAIVEQFGITTTAIYSVMVNEQAELGRRNKLYRNNLPPPQIEGKTIIVVDDGLATGATMRVAIAVLQHMKAKHIIAAIPVGPAETCMELEADIDEVVCLYTPEPFYGVGQWYNDFSQTSDEEVLEILGFHYSHQYGKAGYKKQG